MILSELEQSFFIVSSMQTEIRGIVISSHFKTLLIDTSVIFCQKSEFIRYKVKFITMSDEMSVGLAIIAPHSYLPIIEVELNRVFYKAKLFIILRKLLQKCDKIQSFDAK